MQGPGCGILSVLLFGFASSYKVCWYPEGQSILSGPGSAGSYHRYCCEPASILIVWPFVLVGCSPAMCFVTFDYHLYRRGAILCNLLLGFPAFHLNYELFLSQSASECCLLSSVPRVQVHVPASFLDSGVDRYPLFILGAR